MLPSSRTPEGHWADCPICRRSVCVEPSSFPTRDAPCPRCGCLLEFPVARQRVAHATRPRGDGRYARTLPATPEPFGRFERAQWAILTVVSSIFVWLSDGLALAGVWFAGTFVLGQIVLPPVYRWLLDPIRAKDFAWTSIAYCWALIGLPSGMLVGVMVPCATTGDSSFACGILGLILGPIIGAVEGLVIAAVAAALVWLVTGRSLFDKL